MIKRTLIFLITLVTLSIIAACQAPVLSASSGVTPIQSAAPFSSPTPASTSATPKPSTSAMPEPALSDEGILGEWAGYISKAEYDFLYRSPCCGYAFGETNPTYAAKLTITESGAWLSLDLLSSRQDFSSDVPKLAAPTGNFGANLSVSELGEASVSLKLEDYAYRQRQDVPFQNGSAFALSYHRLISEEERMDSEVFRHTPAYIPECSNDMLYGKLGEWTVSLARLTDSSSPKHNYPSWYGYAGFVDGVRGVYGFGERGADNSFSSYIFVYHDKSGFEHIRLLFGEFYLPESLYGEGCFVNWSPIYELGVSFMATPWWATLYTLDTQTGEFIDVSEQHRAYYRDEVLPSVRRGLLYALYAGGEKKDSFALQQLNYDKEHYFRVYEAAYGKRPDALPKLKPPAANSKAVYADIDGDGDDDKVEIMFFNTENEDAKDYDAAWFCVNGIWRYYVIPGDSASGHFLLPDFAIVSLDGSGVEIALEVDSDSDPCVSLYRLYDSAGMAYVCNDALWGRVVSDSDDLRVKFHGDGSVTGFRRSVFSDDLVIRFAYSSQGGFLNLDRPEDGLYEMESPKARILAEPLCAHLERDASSQTILLSAGQPVFPIASDEVAWLKMRTSSGQVFWVYCQSEDDSPKFK